MAGTVTTTERASNSRSVKVIKFAWLSSNPGQAADATTTGIYDGKLIAMTTIPDAVAAPTVDYDITLEDSNGVDVLLGAGIDRHNANTEYVAEASLGAVAGSTLTLGVTTAGAAKEGEMYVWIR